MPPRKSQANPTPGRERLTLAKLASYDDVATDALVDRVRFSPSIRDSELHPNSFYHQAYFWTNTRKNRTKYNPARGIRDDDVARILLHDVIIAKNVPQAERKLLDMPGLKKYMASLPSPREKEWFCRHVRKYIQIYHPDCPFEITTTNRYTITEHEAAICARKFIKAGAEIKFLSGTLVAMTEEEELDLGLTRKDFSIVMSSRRKTPSFFLGPARFANHDCNANGRLATRGTEGMSVVATRNIHVGEEITVSYGDNYFGIDNCECLCLTCERAFRNGWSPHAESDSNSKESSPASLDEVALVEIPPVSKKRRRDSLDAESSPSACSTPRKREKFQRQESKLREEISMSELAGESAISMQDAETSIALDAGVDPACTPNKQELVDESATPMQDPETAVAPNSGVDPSATPKQEQQAPTLREELKASIEAFTEPVPEASPANFDRALSSSPGGDDCNRSSTSTAPTSIEEIGGVKANTEIIMETTELEAEVTNEESHTELDKPRKKRAYRRRRFAIPSIENKPPVTRVPGDYTKTSKLLALRYDRWVDCQTCDTWFVQSNSYLTRRECPRCERHSMLYGFRWPKTDKEGPWDDDERVMDHRTIHRFLNPEEEKGICRRDRGVSFGITLTPELSDAPRTETEMSDTNDELRRSSRRRTRGLRVTM